MILLWFVVHAKEFHKRLVKTQSHYSLHPCSIHVFMLGSGTMFELLLGESSLLGGRIVRADL